MKLFVIDKNGTKLYLDQIASTRQELAEKLGSSKFTLNKKKYSVNDVIAEPENSSTVTGAVTGAIVGIIFGPLGAITGGLLGSIIGNSSQNEGARNVLTFNSSKVEKVKL